MSDAEDWKYWIVNGNCVDVMNQMQPNGIDAIVCDPPYEINFMSKGWDNAGVAFDVETWKAAYRVLKPGGHLLAFGATRTYHRMAVAIEDAGFEIRDSIMWIYGTGFPKSHDVSKAIDKELGAEREVIGTKQAGIGTGNSYGKIVGAREEVTNRTIPVTAPGSPEPLDYQGFGTALKPGHEPIVVARKPLSEKTIAANVLKWGTGAINIDGCRLAPRGKEQTQGAYSGSSDLNAGTRIGGKSYGADEGRWPANVIFDEERAAELDEQSGDRPAGGKVKGTEPSHTGDNGIYNAYDRVENHPYEDTGGASRFFYVAKPSKAERNQGLEDMPARVTNEAAPPGSSGANSPRAGASPIRASANFHPTVKPVQLMRYLVRLVTPPGGTVLDPFVGSGTTLMGAVQEGFRCVGIELDPEYIELATKRVESCLS